MKNLLRLPRWSITLLIAMTVLLSILILAKIWFPAYVPDDLFSKIFFTYVVLICSSAVIAKMTEYLKEMGDPDETKKEAPAAPQQNKDIP